MFNLFRSQGKAVRYLLGILLGLVALSLVVTLIPGFGTPSAAPEQIVAEIGGQALTVREVQTTVQGALKGQKIPPEMIPFYVPQIVDQMITERAIAYQAERMGFKITDEELANAIRSMIAQYFPGEIRSDEYARFLGQQNLTIAEFERNVKTNLLLLRLQNLALEGAVVTPDEVEKEFRRRNDKIKVEYVKWTPPTDLRSQVTLNEGELKAYYESQKSTFVTPEKRTFQLLISDGTKIAETLQVPEPALRAAYNANLDRYRTGERVKVRHILIKTTEKNAAEQAAAEKKAQDLLKQIKAGGDFAALAQKNSDDPGSASRGGDLDWVTRGQTVPNFEKAAFALAPKQISELVKTEYGFHILQVMEKEVARVKPFEEVRAELESAGKLEAVNTKMQESIEQARAELVKSPKNGAQIAAKYGLSFYVVEKAVAGSSVPELGTNQELENALRGVKTGEITQVTQVAPAKLAVAVMTQLDAPRQADFAEVADQVRDRMLAMRVQQLSDQKRQQATVALKGANGDIRAAAKALGLEVKTTDFFTVEGAAEGIGTGTYFAEGFQKPAGHVVGPFNVGDQVFLARVLEKQGADLSKLPAERETIVLALKRKQASERKELFEDGLISRLLKEGKVKKYPETINRVVANYRG